MQPSRPPLVTVPNAVSIASAQTLSSCTASVEMQRCCPTSQTLMVWSVDPDTHSVPASFSTSALRTPTVKCGSMQGRAQQSSHIASLPSVLCLMAFQRCRAHDGCTMRKCSSTAGRRSNPPDISGVAAELHALFGCAGVADAHKPVR